MKPDRELLEAARQVVYFGQTELAELRAAVDACDQRDRDHGYDEADEHEEEDLENGPVTCSWEGCGTKVYSQDPYFGTPCGTHCTEHMAEHVKQCGVCGSEFRDDFPAKKFTAVQTWITGDGYKFFEVEGGVLVDSLFPDLVDQRFESLAALRAHCAVKPEGGDSASEDQP